MRNELQQWLYIARFEGFYRVSDQGNTWLVRSNKQLIKAVGTTGYEQVTLMRDGKQRGRFVHRLVAQVFNYARTLDRQKAIVDHIDFKRTNNDKENLR